MAISKTSSLQWNATSKDFLEFTKAMSSLQRRLLNNKKKQRILRLLPRIFGRVKRTLEKL
jgi:hypothetical protein